MGIFSRRGNNDPSAATTVAATATASRQSGKSFGHAAFDRADIDDARRGHPAVSLRPFASTAGLGYFGSELGGAFGPTLPAHPEYTFNVCRGVTSRGRLGQVAHELFEVAAENGKIRTSGSFHDVRVTTHTPLLELAGILVRDPLDQPFVSNAVWIPTTTAHVRVPETNRLPMLKIARSGSFSGFGDKSLDKYGLPGYRIVRGKADDGVLAVIAQACAPWLATRPDTHVLLNIRYGLVALTINGYCSHEADLTHLLNCADGVADALARVTPPPSGAPFDALGPAAASVQLPVGVPCPHPSATPAYKRWAAQLDLHNEDITHLMSLIPRCPIPGTPSGVLAGKLPGTSSPCRLVWSEQGGRTSGQVRGGMILQAGPGITTPVGGVLHQTTGMFVEVLDGYLIAWRTEGRADKLDAEGLLQAAGILQAQGLAAI